ncbi:MAG TPA: HNH endonuclease signature motif containing protein [Ktedonobacteraceae bacterium]
MVFIAASSLSINLTPQALAIIIAVLIVVFLLLGIAGRRVQRRRRSGGRTTRRGGGLRARRRDHGLETARKHGKERSPHWFRVAKEHLLRQPACVVCGTRRGLQVHHIKPFHLHPQLELDPNNLITLCELKGRDHHLLIGHLDEWASFNVNVHEDAKRHRNKTANQIRADPAWQKAVAKRPSGVPVS